MVAPHGPREKSPAALSPAPLSHPYIIEPCGVSGARQGGNTTLRLKRYAVACPGSGIVDQA